MGGAYADLGQPQQAIGLYEQQLAIARVIGNRHGEGIALGNMGNAYGELGQPQRAVSLLKQSLEIAKAIQNSSLVTFATYRLERWQGEEATPPAQREMPGTDIPDADEAVGKPARQTKPG